MSSLETFTTSGKSRSEKIKQNPSDAWQQPLFKPQETDLDSAVLSTETTKSETLGQPPTKYGVQDFHLLGAENELKAQAWYLRKGYQVYIPVVQQGGIDFIAYKDKEYIRVQVKTATVTTTNANTKQFGCCVAPTKARLDLLKEHDMFDVLFVVSNEDCWVIPFEEVTVAYLTLASPSRGHFSKFKKYRDFI